jgi:anthranilate synthase component 1
MEISCTDKMLRVVTNVEGGEPTVTTTHVDHPAAALRAVVKENSMPQLEGFPPLAGGLVGYFSYDYLKYAEPTLARSDLDHGDFRDCDLMLFDRLVAFDTYRSRIVLMASVPTDNVDTGYAQALADIDHTESLLRGRNRREFAPLKLEGKLTPKFSEKRYCAMVEEAKRHIYEGDIFQVVLSNPLTTSASGSLFDTYRLLRCNNPSPYMFYFASDDIELAGASPETLGKLTNGILETYPLAGTRPRGTTREEDERLERELLADEKELAEHTMLVDLGRNDLGRISKLGSVRVSSLMNVLRFSHVMHIGSTVQSQIADDKDALDAIDAILPAGTLSGAPKVRACQIIYELEKAKRGIYGGAVGYLDFSGNMDTCIGIRLAYKKDGMVCVQSGAGIVADSVPEREYQECVNKARAVVEALEEAQGGLA